MAEYNHNKNVQLWLFLSEAQNFLNDPHVYTFLVELTLSMEVLLSISFFLILMHERKQRKLMEKKKSPFKFQMLVS